jgi:hypothetical protein
MNRVNEMHTDTDADERVAPQAWSIATLNGQPGIGL